MCTTTISSIEGSLEVFHGEKTVFVKAVRGILKKAFVQGELICTFRTKSTFIRVITICFLCLQEGVEVRVARIFNTFGPRMHMNDGRVVSNFILQALQGEPLTVSNGHSMTRRTVCILSYPHVL